MVSAIWISSNAGQHNGEVGDDDLHRRRGPAPLAAVVVGVDAGAQVRRMPVAAVKRRYSSLACLAEYQSRPL